MPGRQEPSTINESRVEQIQLSSNSCSLKRWAYQKYVTLKKRNIYIYILIISPFNNFLYFILTNISGRQEPFYHKWMPCWTDATFKQQLLLETMNIPKICHIEETKNIFFNNITFSLLQLFNILSNFLYFISFV